MNLELIKSAASRYLGRGIYQAVELRHSGFSQDWNLINSGGKPITIEATTYESFPFSMTLSPQGETTATALSFANVDRRIAQEIAKAVTNEDILADIYLVHIERVNGVAIGERYFKGSFTVTAAEISQEAVSLSIALKSSLSYNAGALRFNSNDFGNIYL